MTSAGRFTRSSGAALDHAICILTMLFIASIWSRPSTRNIWRCSRPTKRSDLGSCFSLDPSACACVPGASLPSDLSPPMKLAAHLSHYALYALMIALPLIAGRRCRRGYPVVLWGASASADRAAER